MSFPPLLSKMGLSMLCLALVQLGAASGVEGQTSAVQDGSRAGQTFRIAGMIVNAMTGEPLSQARISIADTRDRSKPLGMITSEDGHFEFSQLKAGKYSLSGAKRGFISAAYEQHEQYSTAIVTGEEFATENLVLRLTPMALITGHVTDEFGEGVRSASVVLYFENHTGGMTRITRYSNSMSDDRGFYDFSLLRPGKYYVSVTAKPWYAIHPASAVDGASAPATQVSPALDAAYPTTYYDGATASRHTQIVMASAMVGMPYTVHVSHPYSYISAPQAPPSPPVEEAPKCSLPSISTLLGLADSPTTQEQAQGMYDLNMEYI